jgi:hypothetical protein
VSNNIAQLPNSYALTLTLSHAWERGCDPADRWRFLCSSTLWFRILDLDLDAYSESQEYQWDSNHSKYSRLFRWFVGFSMDYEVRDYSTP